MSATVPPSLTPFSRDLPLTRDPLSRTALRPNSPNVAAPAPRLMSLDVFRGLVILAMLVVNNLGDGRTTGYFWKHAEWPAMRQGYAWRAWWGYATDSPAWKERLAHIPLERYQLEAKLGTKRVQLRLTTRSADEMQTQRLAFEVDQLERQLAVLDEEQQLAAAPWRRIPIFTYCTLADYVMPAFMLIIGVAMPFSVAAAAIRGVGAGKMWLRTFRRVFMLVLLGWILVYFRDDFALQLHGEEPWSARLGMDVLQLLGLGYLVARFGYGFVPPIRATLIVLLFVWHWALLKFAPQGSIVPAGTFSPHYEAAGYIYSRWPVIHLLGDHVSVVLNGLLSIPPAAATMLIGTLIGDWLTRDVESRVKVARLALWGVVLALVGLAWGMDLPFNKPRWTPAYLVYVSGVGAIVLAGLYAAVDQYRVREWGYFAVVFGANAIAVYWLSIMAKILLLNTPRVAGDNYRVIGTIKYATLAAALVTLGAIAWRAARWVARYLGPAAYAMLLPAVVGALAMWKLFQHHPIGHPKETATMQSIAAVVLTSLKGSLGDWAGGWVFTVTFVAFWWLVLDWMYRRRIFWKL